MSDEQVLVEAAAADGGDDARGDSGEIAESLLIGGGEDKWDKSGARFDDFEAELTGEVIAETGGAHFGDGQAAGGDDECGSAEFADGS